MSQDQAGWPHEQRGQHCCQPPLTCCALRSWRKLYLVKPAVRRVFAQHDRSRSFRSAAADARFRQGEADPRIACPKAKFADLRRPAWRFRDRSLVLRPSASRLTRRSCQSPKPFAPRESGHPSTCHSLHLRFAMLIPGGTCEAGFPILLRAAPPHLQFVFFLSISGVYS